MNRAWIPAGALAGVSVAGLIALGPLTDSMGTSVSFPGAITGAQDGHASSGSSNELLPVRLKIDAGRVGTTQTNGSDRGGPATPSASDTEGFVSVQVHKQPAPTNASSSSKGSSTKVTPKKPKPKKTVRLQIGTTGQTNSDKGLSGDGSSGSTGQGEQSVTPSSDGN